MKTLVVGLILMFDASNGELVGQNTAVFETMEECIVVTQITLQKSQTDLLTVFEGTCTESPLIVLEKAED